MNGRRHARGRHARPGGAAETVEPPDPVDAEAAAWLSDVTGGAADAGVAGSGALSSPFGMAGSRRTRPARTEAAANAPSLPGVMGGADALAREVAAPPGTAADEAGDTGPLRGMPESAGTEVGPTGAVGLSSEALGRVPGVASAGAVGLPSDVLGRASGAASAGGVGLPSEALGRVPGVASAGAVGLPSDVLGRASGVASAGGVGLPSEGLGRVPGVASAGAIGSPSHVLGRALGATSAGADVPASGIRRQPAETIGPRPGEVGGRGALGSRAGAVDPVLTVSGTAWAGADTSAPGVRGSVAETSGARSGEVDRPGAVGSVLRTPDPASGAVAADTSVFAVPDSAVETAGPGTEGVSIPGAVALATGAREPGVSSSPGGAVEAAWPHPGAGTSVAAGGAVSPGTEAAPRADGISLGEGTASPLAAADSFGGAVASLSGAADSFGGAADSLGGAVDGSSAGSRVASHRSDVASLFSGIASRRPGIRRKSGGMAAWAGPGVAMVRSAGVRRVVSLVATRRRQQVVVGGVAGLGLAMTVAIVAGSGGAPRAVAGNVPVGRALPSTVSRSRVGHGADQSALAYYWAKDPISARHVRNILWTGPMLRVYTDLPATDANSRMAIALCQTAATYLAGDGREPMVFVHANRNAGYPVLANKMNAGDDCRLNVVP
jgi:hypothetical protein